jgi:hypothetical protein
VPLWVSAVNAEGSFGKWAYAVAKKLEEVARKVEDVVSGLESSA